jgi:hypothetical protein
MADKRSDRSPGVDTASVLAGGRPTVRLNLKLAVTPEHAPELERLVPGEVAETLLAQRDTLLEWVGRSRDNQATFLTDPLDALDKAGIKLDAGERAALHRSHRRRQPDEMLPAGVDLASLSVTVESKKKGANGSEHREGHGGKKG